MIFINQDLCIQCPLVDRTSKYFVYMCLYVYTTHSHPTYIHIYFSMCVCDEYTSIFPIQIQHYRFTGVFSSIYIKLLSPTTEKPGSHYPLGIHLLLDPPVYKVMSSPHLPLWALVPPATAHALLLEPIWPHSLVPFLVVLHSPLGHHHALLPTS